MNEAIALTISALGGVSILEGIKFIYPDIKQYFKAKNEAKKIFYENLDPILKASDELFGKISSLAKEDFSTFLRPNSSNSHDPIHNQKYTFYLFAQFWAHIEYLRLHNQYINLSRINKGKELLQFIETIES